ncbi:hypothetical protein IE077_003240, partial [Cardiosporidium cionae]
MRTYMQLNRQLICSYHDAIDWIHLINLSCKQCEAFFPIKLTPESKFWKISRISPQKFESIANTGDIVLFKLGTIDKKCQRMNALIQRTLTRSEYDHIAMILRSDCNKIHVLEAIGNAGVVINPWGLHRKLLWSNQFTKSDTFTIVNAYLLFQITINSYILSIQTLLIQVIATINFRVALRKVFWERSTEKLNVLLQFLKDTYGAKYHLSVSKLLRRYSY